MKTTTDLPATHHKVHLNYHVAEARAPMWVLPKTENYSFQESKLSNAKDIF